MDSFILYTSQYPAIKSLSKSAKGELLEALYQYALSGKVPPFSQAQTEMAFNFIRIRIDENNAKYLNVCEKRRAAGRMGGRPRKEHSKDHKKANKPNAFPKSKAKQKKLTDTNTESINTDTLSEVSEDTSQKNKKKKTRMSRLFLTLRISLTTINGKRQRIGNSGTCKLSKSSTRLSRPTSRPSVLCAPSPSHVVRLSRSCGKSTITPANSSSKPLAISPVPTTAMDVRLIAAALSTSTGSFVRKTSTVHTRGVYSLSNKAKV